MPDNNKIKSDEIVQIARGQAVVEARQPIERDCKVLSVSATACARPSEVFTGEVRYAGKVRFDCLVFSSGKLDCISTVAEFSDKINSPKIGIGLNPQIVADVVNCEATYEGGAVKMVAVIDTTVDAAIHNDCDAYDGNDDGIYVERKTVSYGTVIGEPTEVVYISDAVTDIKATDVLCVTSRAVIDTVESGADEIKISGNVYSTAVAQTADGLATPLRVVTPFVKSIAAPGADVGDIAYANACVTDSSATFVSDGEENRLELTATLSIDGTVVRPSTAEVAVDVFCSDSELETTTAICAACEFEPQTTVTDSVDGQIALAADRLAADNVLCVKGEFCTVTDAHIDDGRVVVEGLVGGDIVYYNAESNAVDSIAFRLPFSMPLGIHTSADNVRVTAVVTDVNVKVRRESVFDIKAETAFTVRLGSCEKVAMIETVKRGAEIARPNATVVVHIAKPGETLWQAARALGCSPDKVREQNDCDAPYSGGERLINFCGK